MSDWKPRTLEEWHAKVRDAQADLDIAMRGDLPAMGQTTDISNLRGLVQNLDFVLFRGFAICEPSRELKNIRNDLTLEDLFS